MNELTANDLLTAIKAQSGTITHIALLGEGALIGTAQALSGWGSASGGKIAMTDSDIDFTITSGYNGSTVYTILLFSSNVSTTDYTKAVASYVLPTPITVTTDDIVRVSALELGFK